MDTQYFSDCFTFQKAKNKYMELALVHHPEKGGDYEIMREINIEYKSIYVNLMLGLDTETAQVRQEFYIFPIIISRIICLEGTFIEMYNKRLYVGGETYKYHNLLEELGFVYSFNISRWVYTSIKAIQASETSIQFELPL